MKALELLTQRLARRPAYAGNNVRADCVCGVAREAITDRLWRVTDKIGDLILPQYMYRCPSCRSFSAVNLFFPVGEYESMTLEMMAIPEVKTRVNVARLDWIKERHRLPATATLFDLGSGEGTFTHVFATAYPQGTVLSVDADAKIQTKFYGQAPNVTFVPEFIESFLERAPRDPTVPRPHLMILTDVLEHVTHPENVVRLVAGALPAGACVYITVPDSRTFQPPFPYPVAARKVDWEEANHTRQHLWMLEPDVLVGLIRKHLEVVDVSGFETDIRQDSLYTSVLARKAPGSQAPRSLGPASA